VLGSVSAIFWTLTFQTTIKYVFITMRADNHGEGGIFSLFTLIRKEARWLVWPAIIGGSFMIADSLITPPISVTSAIEGLKGIAPNVPVMPITLVILVVLFLFQQAGTRSIGNYFGPAMVIWFAMIAIFGGINLAKNPWVLQAINPMYAWKMVVQSPGGFWVLGSVFLCATGAEALYADMGHVGRKNIQVAWIFIKISLMLCYFGEASLLQSHMGETLNQIDPFYGMMPGWFLLPSIVISTLATIIASQALISGTFTLFNEAIRLNIWPRLRVVYPSDIQGQVYVPAINWLMMLGCIGMVLYFRESANMEAAFGLSVTLTMLMTTFLLSFYLHSRHNTKILTWGVFCVYLAIESTFLISNLKKFAHGGWITVLIGSLLVTTMYVWFVGKKIKNRYRKNVLLNDYKFMLKKLSNDASQPIFATHLAYLTVADKPNAIEQRIIESILYHQPKRANHYWLLHIEVDDAPYTMKYSAEVVSPDDIIYVKFKLGFRVVPRISLLFHKVIRDLAANKEITIPHAYYSLNQNFKYGDIKFVIMKSFLSFDNELPYWKNLLMNLHYVLDKISLSDAEAFGLDYNDVAYEYWPLIVNEADCLHLVRTNEPGQRV